MTNNLTYQEQQEHQLDWMLKRIQDARRPITQLACAPKDCLPPHLLEALSHIEYYFTVLEIYSCSHSLKKHQNDFQELLEKKASMDAPQQ